MVEYQNSQEKLLSMLTEIHSQLEELESVLECSLSDLQSTIQNQHLNHLEKYEEKITQLERTLSIDRAKQTEKNVYTNSPQKLKLELGF